jgi:hypothetical protein
MLEGLMIKRKYPTTINVLRDAIEGKDTSISQSEAVHLLRKGNFPNKYKIFEKLLRNPNIPLLVKYLAFIELGKTNTIKARNILLRSAKIVKDERLLVSILKGLGFCGDKSSIKAILKIRKNARGSVRKQAEFNADLISYRLNLKGIDFLVQVKHKYLNITDKSKSIDFRPAVDKQEIRRIFGSIKDNPFGIRTARSPVYEIKTGNIKHFLVLNEKFSTKGDIIALLKQKAILGLIIRKIEDRYSIMYLILSAPDKRATRINILIARSNGNVKIRGFAQLADNVINFFLKSVLKPGNFPLLVEGSINITESKLKISSAKFSPHIYRKKTTLSGNPIRW